MAKQISPESMLVIARIGGSSSSRRQERRDTVAEGEALIALWAAEGYTTFWAEVGEQGLSKPFRLVDGERQPLS
uniref:Resolvase/invertase-type recombinase catalytic domain-containing protein n=1 Tax=Streptomyces sp. NBC_01393 TaxID=2903851 RepID=A0AAU3I5W1_9ACTN